MTLRELEERAGAIVRALMTERGLRAHEAVALFERLLDVIALSPASPN